MLLQMNLGLTHYNIQYVTDIQFETCLRLHLIVVILNYYYF